MRDQRQPSGIAAAPAAAETLTQFDKIDGALIFVCPAGIVDLLQLGVNENKGSRAEQGIHPPVIQPDVLANGVQNQVQNIIVQVVHITYGPWLENFEGGEEVQAKIADNAGKAYVFRNGRMIVGRWTHGSLTSPTVFTNTAGKVISLAPGRTWVEVFPDVDPVAVTFPPRH